MNIESASIFILIFGILLTFKLVGIATLSWFYVFLPLLLFPILVVLFLIFIFTLIFLSDNIKLKVKK